MLTAFLLQQSILAQLATYAVNLVPFCSSYYDEFSPVYYKNGIVFCTNQGNKSLVKFSNSQNKSLFKIYFIDTTLSTVRQGERLFSKDLTTKLNDGPVTFNGSGDTIYYSRNLDVVSKSNALSNARNKLGLFYAVHIDGRWTKIGEFRINNEWHNVTAPSLTPNGKKIFFASDKSGGYGGMDLYYSIKKEGYFTLKKQNNLSNYSCEHRIQVTYRVFIKHYTIDALIAEDTNI